MSASTELHFWTEMSFLLKQAAIGPCQGQVRRNNWLLATRALMFVQLRHPEWFLPFHFENFSPKQSNRIVWKPRLRDILLAYAKPTHLRTDELSLTKHIYKFILPEWFLFTQNNCSNRGGGKGKDSTWYSPIETELRRCAFVTNTENIRRQASSVLDRVAIIGYNSYV